MWFLKWIGLGLLIVFVLVFSLENVGSPALKAAVSLKLFGAHTAELPVFLWLGLFFLFGMLLILVFALIRELRFRSEIGLLNREIDQLQQSVPLVERGEVSGVEKLL